MNVGTLIRWPSSRNGTTDHNGSTEIKLSTKQRERVRELQRSWLALALSLVADSQGTDTTVLAVTSAERGEGKTTNCMGLASAIANESDTTVLVVECDLPNPSISDRLDLMPTPGINEYLTHEATIEEIVQRTNNPHLDVIVAGDSNDNGGALGMWSHPGLSLLNRNFPQLLSMLAQMYKFILLDMPPILTNPYTKEMMRFTDRAFVAVKSGTTDMENVERAAKEIEDGKLSGVLLMGANSTLPNWVNSMLSEIE